MPSAKVSAEIHLQAEAALMESVWAKIREVLHNERHRVNEEIRNYPTPIPACDAQFNYLLEERARIPQELKRLERLAQAGSTRRDQIKRVEEFIESSNFISGEVERQIRSSLPSVTDGGA